MEFKDWLLIILVLACVHKRPSAGVKWETVVENFCVPEFRLCRHK